MSGLETLWCIQQTWACVLETIFHSHGWKSTPTRTIMAPEYRFSSLLLAWEASSKLG